MTQPYFPGQYPQQAMPVEYYPSGPRYAGLSKRQKRAAAWAGAVGLNLMSFGGTLMVIVAVVAILIASFAGISSSADTASGLRGFDDFLAESRAPVWLAVVAVIGVAVLLLGMFLSVAILRAADVRRPFAVTWSAFGITVPVLTILNFIGGFLAQIIIAATAFATIASAAGGTRPDPESVTVGIVVAVIAVVFSVGIVGVIGWLAWWWMTHAFRERIPVAWPSRIPPARQVAGSEDGTHPRIQGIG